MRAVTSHWMFRGAAVVTAALVVEYATQFGRSIALTRSLAPAEFGIASAMAILLTLIDMSTGIGADRFLVQARDGDSSEALAVAHTLTLLRSLLNAALVVLLAVPTALILGVPQATGSFFWLAAIPLVRGFEHLRLGQMQRGQRFLPWAGASASANVIGLIAVTCASLVLRDHRAVLWGLGTQTVALVLATHICAGTRYRISFAAGPAMRALRFGVPLMLNGLALAALSQFDRLAVGSILGVAQLGRYGLAAMMFYLPTSLLLRVTMTVLQPRLSAAWHDSPLWRFPAMFRQFNSVMAVVGALAGATVVIGGAPLLAIVFGRVYAVGDVFFAVYGFAVFMRFAKGSANFGGLAIGRTMDMMLSNIPGALGLLVTIVGLKLMPALVVAAAGSVVGESLGAGAAFGLLARHLNVPARACWTPFAMALPLPCAAAAWVLLAQPSYTARLIVLGVLAACAAFSLLLVQQKGRPQVAL